MTQGSHSIDLAEQRALAERILASPQINKSARLTDLFAYLCRRVLDEGATQINELELGNKVFGREPRYDTTADNIVRVHASLLRKRLAEYFAAEGRLEEFTIEIPRGNYAPVFRRRDVFDLTPDAPEQEPATTPGAAADPLEEPAVAAPPPPLPRLFWPASTAVCALTALGLAIALFHRPPAPRPAGSSLRGSAVASFWTSVFPAHQIVDVVTDDAALAFIEASSGHNVSINEYFDRSYQRSLSQSAPAADLLQQLIIQRDSSFGTSAMTWRLAQIADETSSQARLVFARALTFRQAREENLVLLGTSSSNPWIQLFDPSTTIRWKYDPTVTAFYPIDTLAGKDTLYKAGDKPDPDSRTHNSYASVALLPNIGGAGHTLIISGTGGAALDAAMDWLTQDASIQQLRSKIPGGSSGTFPFFEALLKIERAADRGRGVTVVFVRAPRPDAPSSPR